MPLESIQEWRARIGSSWCALGRPMKSKSPHGTGRPKSCRAGGGRTLSSCVQDHPAFVLMVVTALLAGLCNVSIWEFHTVDLFFGFFEQGQLDGCLFQWMAFFYAILKKGLFSASHLIDFSTRCLISNVLLSLQLTTFFVCQPFLLAYSCCVFLLKLLSPIGKFFTNVWRLLKPLLFNSWLRCKDCCQVVMAGMRLLQLRFASNTLMGLLAAVTIYSLLLQSGNVESNPGPRDKTSQSVTETKNESISEDDYLDFRDMGEVLEFFWDYRLKWKMIGIELGIDMHTLHVIDMDHGSDVKYCLVDLIKMWLQRRNPKPTRTVMTAVMQSMLVTTQAPDLRITKHPQNQSNLKIGDAVELSVSAEGFGTLAYQWKKDDNLVSDESFTGADTCTLTISSFSEKHVGIYKCLVSSDSGSELESNGAKLSYLMIIKHPQSQPGLKIGDEVELSVSAKGSSTLTYQWKKDNKHIADGSLQNLTGAKGCLLIIKEFLHKHIGTYSCLVTCNSDVTVESHHVELMIGGALLVIDHFCKVQELIWGAHSEYENLGYALHLRPDDVQSIKLTNCSDTKRCFNDVLTKVLNQGVTQENLAQALESKRVGHLQLARKVREAVFYSGLEFSVNMSDNDFIAFMKSKGLQDKDAAKLTDNGITATIFVDLTDEDINDPSLNFTFGGKKAIRKALSEIKKKSSAEASIC